jgi:hypothetical protein
MVARANQGPATYAFEAQEGGPEWTLVNAITAQPEKGLSMRTPYPALVVACLVAGTANAQPPPQAGGEQASPGWENVLRLDESASASRLWFSTDYLLLWVKKAPLATPLVTTDPTNGQSPTAGGLADPTTIGVLGGSPVRFGALSAGRLEGGWMLNEGFAVEAGGFLTGKQTERFGAGSNANGDQFLFRPFLNVDTGNPNAGSFVALQGLITGAVDVSQTTELWGTDIRLAGSLLRSGSSQLYGLAGFRYLDLYEKLDIYDARTDLAGIGNFGGPATNPGDRFLFQDSFHTRNQFYGFEAGLRGETRCGPLVLSGTASIALGDSRETVTIGGSTTLMPATGGTATLPGGILALPSNSGHFVYNRFAVVPEVGLQLGWDMTSWLRLSIGYDFLYWSSVMRPGDQVVPVISASRLPSSPSFGTGGSAVPPPPHNTTDFWAQGISFDLTFRY